MVLPPSIQDYLERLEAIRKQNYKERIQIQQRMAKVRGPVAKVLNFTTQVICTFKNDNHLVLLIRQCPPTNIP